MFFCGLRFKGLCIFDWLIALIRANSNYSALIKQDCVEKTKMTDFRIDSQSISLRLLRSSVFQKLLLLVADSCPFALIRGQIFYLR